MRTTRSVYESSAKQILSTAACTYRNLQLGTVTFSEEQS